MKMKMMKMNILMKGNKIEKREKMDKKISVKMIHRIMKMIVKVQIAVRVKMKRVKEANSVKRVMQVFTQVHIEKQQQNVHKDKRDNKLHKNIVELKKD